MEARRDEVRSLARAEAPRFAGKASRHCFVRKSPLTLSCTPDYTLRFENSGKIITLEMFLGIFPKFLGIFRELWELSFTGIFE